MAQREWEKARNDFFEAFKNYDEAGVQRRVQCLKYLVLANMLMNSDINPFDSQEAKPYKNDPEILAMTNLVSAYMRNEIREFEKLLKQNSRTVMGDAFIRNYIEDLLKNIRTQVCGANADSARATGCRSGPHLCAPHRCFSRSSRRTRAYESRSSPRSSTSHRLRWSSCLSR